ncbi:MAG: alpha/beta hydrolase [Anaerolineaceae bacterium]|nr:alpha/beta hydrolase [Anaerolineaceae bacterium]
MSTVDFTLNSGDCVTLFYICKNAGAKKTLLFLHGLGTTHESWKHQIEYFQAAGYCVVAVDSPGFGQSKISKGHFSVELAAACIQNLLDYLHICKAIVVGHSMGGPLAIHCAIHAADYFDKCVLINTFARIKPTNLATAFAFVKRFVLANLQDTVHQAEFIAEKTFPGESEKELRETFKKHILSTDKVIYREAVNELARINYLNQLGSINIPTLVLTGMQDQTISPILQDELFERISNAIQIKVKNGRHGMIFSQHEVINHYLQGFLTDDHLIR